MPRRLLNLLTAILLLAAGCTVEQHREFRGKLTHDAPPGAAAPPAVQQLGGDFHYRRHDLADAVTGFHLPESKAVLVLVHDRARFESNRFRLSTDAVSGVYLAGWTDPHAEPWKTFVELDAAARDGVADVRRLRGQFGVERWKSSVDFRVRLAMRTDGPTPVTVDGVLVSYDRLEFHPAEWVGAALLRLGIVNPP